MLIEILSYIKSNDGVTLTEICKHCNCDRAMVETIVEHLIHIKKIERYSETNNYLCSCKGCTNARCNKVEVYKVVDKNL